MTWQPPPHWRDRLADAVHAAISDDPRSTRALSLAAGFSRATIGHIGNEGPRGKTNAISMAVLVKLGAALDVRPSEILRAAGL